MKKWIKSCGALAIISLVLGLWAASSLADDVCRFTEVVGQVNLMKFGAGEAVPAKEEMGAAEKDMVNTKVASRAQLKFIDASMLTIAPLSDVTIESYMYDASKARRHGVIDLTQGVVHAVVTNLQKAREPDVLIKTPTAIMGIRGTTAVVLCGRDEKCQPFEVVHVPEGVVEVYSADPNLKFSLTLGNGEALGLVAGQIPGPKDIMMLKGADAAKLNKLVDTGIPAVVHLKGSNPLAIVNAIIAAGPPTAAPSKTCPAEEAPPPPAPPPPPEQSNPLGTGGLHS